MHASDKETELAFRSQYRAFVDAFRAGAQRLLERARTLVDLFPLWSKSPRQTRPRVLVMFKPLLDFFARGPRPTTTAPAQQAAPAK